MFIEANERLRRLIDRGPDHNKHYKLLHLHIPKTAGVSFMQPFLVGFGDTLHLPWDNGGPTWKQTVQNGTMPRFTTGHIRFREIFFGPVVSKYPLLIMSIVRAPLERAVSDYNYMRSNRHPNNAEFFSAVPTIDAYIERRTLQKNIQSTWLCGVNDDVESVIGAVSRHFVGLAPMERIDAYSERLQYAFLAGRPSNLERRNELQHILHGEKAYAEDISPKVLSAFNEANKIDNIIYDNALDSWDKVFGE